MSFISLAMASTQKALSFFLVKCKGFVDGLRQFNAKFMGSFQIMQIAFSHKRNNTILPQDARNPPVESWFMVNAKDLSMFGSFNMVRLLEVCKVLPRRRAVFSSAAKFLTIS